MNGEYLDDERFAVTGVGGATGGQTAALFGPADLRQRRAAEDAPQFDALPAQRHRILARNVLLHRLVTVLRRRAPRRHHVQIHFVAQFVLVPAIIYRIHYSVNFLNDLFDSLFNRLFTQVIIKLRNYQVIKSIILNIYSIIQLFLLFNQLFTDLIINLSR